MLVIPFFFFFFQSMSLYFPDYCESVMNLTLPLSYRIFIKVISSSFFISKDYLTRCLLVLNAGMNAFIHNEEHMHYKDYFMSNPTYFNRFMKKHVEYLISSAKKIEQVCKVINTNLLDNCEMKSPNQLLKFLSRRQTCCQSLKLCPPRFVCRVYLPLKKHKVCPDIPKDVPETSVDIIERENNNVILSSTPLQNGKTNGNINHCNDSDYSRSPNLTPLKQRPDDNSPNKTSVLSELSYNDQNQNESKTNTIDSLIGRNSFDNKLPNNRNTSDTNINSGTGEGETRKRRGNADRGYFIAKELLSTERTYRKDLEVINIYFRDEVSKAEEEMPDDVLNGLFTLMDPLNEAHCRFLREIEQRLALWEGRSNAHLKGDTQRLGDIILHNLIILPLYAKYLDKHLLVLERLVAAFRKNKKFEQIYKDFELQRVCYLPLTSFIIKPLQRLLHYNDLLGRLMKHYGPDHMDYKDCAMAQAKLVPIVENVLAALKVTENFVQLSELQRDMPSFEGLLQGGREFIRQGCLLKHSKKGFQQRMFFLFSDILVYTNRTTTPSLQFKVHGQMPLRGVMVEESEDKRTGASFSFTIYGGNRTLTVAASSQEEKDKWLEDLMEAIHNARERNDGKMLQYLSLKSCSSSDEIMDKIGEDGNANRDKGSQQRSNTTVHVCWHRNTSTSLKDHLRAFENELSGFLLRKFKNSNGWQKLWVVFTNFCLFFYKTYLDDSPLASLPLLGYTVTVPVEEDDIHKDFVFKLQFKNHVYFFRAESEYTFSRWMEVISSATQHSSRLRLFSRKDSSLNQ